MRGRLCQGMLRAIGLEELIGESVDDYIDIAVKLGTDAEYRTRIVERIKNHKHTLFDDLECVTELDSFWKSQVAQLEANSSV